MGKDATNSEPGRASGEGRQFNVPRPADVPGSTPPPARRSGPPADGGERLSIPSDKPRKASISGIPRSSAVGRVSAPPRPGGPPKPNAKTTSKPAPKPDEAAADAGVAPEAKPVSSVVVTPMRIIGVGVAAAPPPAPGPNDYPTPLEVPAGRRSAPPLPAPPADDEEDEEAVPLRRLSTPPPAPDEPQAAAEPAGSEEDLPPLGAPPPPAPSRDPNGELVPPTRPSAAPAPAPVPTAGASAAGPAPAGSAPAGPSPGAVLAPPPPAAVAAVVDVDVDVAVVSEPLESLDDSDLTEVPSLDASKQRRLPPPPPLRSSFTEGGAEDAKKKPWWEEFFQEDFGLSTPEPAPEQLAIELDFIQQTLAAERGAQILDVGSGNGHHAVALARAGYSVVGIDTSTAMLTRANSRARAASQPVEFVLQDMRELAFDQRFDGVLCWNSTFGYFEREKNHAVLRGIHQALKPGGHFLLDVPNRDFIIDQEPSQNWFECEGCVCMDDMRLDYITSRLVVKRTIMLDDGRNRECHYSMRVFSLHELGRLLHEIGFRVLQVSGSLTTPGIYLGSTSPRLIVLVTRP